MSACSAGMLSAHAGRVVQVGLMMSSTTRAVVLASSVTGTGAGTAGAWFGFGEALAAVVATAVLATWVVGAAVAFGGVGDGVAAGPVQAAARRRPAASVLMRRMSFPLPEAGELPLPHDRVQQCGPALAADHLDRSPERGADGGGIVDRALAVPAERLREQREVRRGLRQVHAEVGLRLVGAAPVGDPELVLPVVVVRAVVVHDQEHRELLVRDRPERSGVEQEIPVGLDVDDELAVAAVRERHADRDADLGGRAQAAAGPADRRVDVEELPGPVLEVGS